MFNYDSSKSRPYALLTSLLACMLPQFLSLGMGLWWLFIAIGVAMILIYRKPEIHGRKRLKAAILLAQLANLIGGICFYYFVELRSEIVLAVAAFNLIFPGRWILLTNWEIYLESKHPNQSA
ncbi:MAG: hypothetical protein WA056_11790 [Gallionella sp.]